MLFTNVMGGVGISIMERSGKRILITGGTGFIGRAVVEALVRRGDEVTVLSRNPARAAEELPDSVRSIAYEPNTEGAWLSEVAGQDVVVHLAGESIGGVRWTDERKREFERSRIGSSETLVRAIARLEPEQRPKALIGASAVGFYGPHPASAELDEASPPGTDYLANLCVRWEGAVAQAKDLGLRVVHTRFGVVLGEGGGALEPILRSFRMHAGGPIGSGEQIMPWVHRDDVVGLILLAIDDSRVSGPINITAPWPVTMRDFAETIGRVLGRRAWLRVPSFAVRALFGEGADPILSGQRALPRVAESLGYTFRFPELEAALRNILDK